MQERDQVFLVVEYLVAVVVVVLVALDQTHQHVLEVRVEQVQQIVLQDHLLQEQVVEVVDQT
tara:strand:+ start:325 stop:510 length:186 start_codon:yes stop_codon:yes gene_type:complete